MAYYPLCFILLFMINHTAKSAQVKDTWKEELPYKMKLNWSKHGLPESKDSHQQKGSSTQKKKQNSYRASIGHTYHEYPFRPLCHSYCYEIFWKSSRFEYDWALSDNFYEYTGYPKMNKWEVHDPHSCVGDRTGTRPGLFVKKNVWVQENRKGILGGLKIAAGNAANTWSKEYRAVFDTAPSCPGRKTGNKNFKQLGYHQYTTGMVSSVREVLYGYFEVRAKTMETQLVNSFWLGERRRVADDDDDDSVKKAGKEIDVFENIHVGAEESKWHFDAKHYTNPNAVAGSKTTSHMADRRYPYKDPKSRKHDEPVSLRPHTYGLLWDANRIVWFFDGEPYAEINNTAWRTPLLVRFEVETNYDLHGIMPRADAFQKKHGQQFIVIYFRHWKVTKE